MTKMSRFRCVSLNKIVNNYKASEWIWRQKKY